VRLVFTASLFYWVSMYLYLPTLGDYVSRRTASLATVGLVLAMYGLWQALVRIPMGIGTDLTGRGKPFIMAGLGFAAAGALVMGFGRSVAVLALGRALTGVAAGVWVPLVIVFSNLFPPERLLYSASVLTLSSSAGQLVSTAANGFLNELGGFQLAFWLASAFAVAAIVVLALTRIDRLPPAKLSIQTFLRLLVRREVMLPTLVSTVILFGVWAVTFSFLSLLAKSLGAGDIAQGLLISTNIAAGGAGNLVGAVLSGRTPERPRLIGSYVVFGLGMVLAGVARALPLLFVATFLSGFAFGSAYPSLMGLSVRHISTGERNTAMGIFQAVYAVGMFTGPWIGGVLSDMVGMRVMFLIMAVFCTMAALALTLLMRQDPWPPR
jgi:MFS family permease